MASRRLLICLVSLGHVLAGATVGPFAIGSAQTSTSSPEVGSCAAYSGLPDGDGDTAGMVFIRRGTFVMGSERHQPEERYTRIVHVDGFWIDRHEVTNAQFRYGTPCWRADRRQAGSSKAAPTCAHPTIAPGTVRPRASRRKQTSAQPISAFARY